MFNLRNIRLFSALTLNVVFAACGGSSAPPPGSDAQSSTGGSGTGGMSGTGAAGGTSGSGGTGGTSGTPKGPAAVSLGSAGNFVVLAKIGISTVPPSHLTGDIGL